MENRCCELLKRSMMLILTAIVSMDFVAMLVRAEPTAIVNTTSGPVRGEILSTFSSTKYASFLGIKYGKAPVGHLRFKPPVAVDPWTEIFDATTAGDVCIQYDSIANETTGSEDCLFINVYTPEVDLAKTPKKLKSVLFWVYGGAFLFGSSTNKILHPDYFLNNDVVFVSLNYRNGLFGFLALGLANATGNAGLKDVVLGLKWVKANIEKFGGDPNNVTIFGPSSGGAVVEYLTLSDSAAGLFHGVIDMSGSALSPWGYSSAATSLSQAERLADVMGLTWTDRETLLQAFYDAPAEDIVSGTNQLSVHFGPFTPTVEDESIATDVFLSRCSLDKYASGNFTKVPHILGYADQETSGFFDGVDTYQSIVNECFTAAQQMNIPLAPSIIAVSNLLNSSTDFKKNLNRTELQKFINDTSDLLFIMGVDLTQRILAVKNNNKPVYYYHTAYFLPGPHEITPKNTHPVKGAGHGDDLRFLFYMPTRNYTDDPTANLTIHRVSTMWSNFVKYGNPTPDWLDDDSLNITWPDSGPSGLSLKIEPEFTIGPRPVPDSTKRLEKRTWPHLREAKGCR